jgi:hypothetical protein
MSIKKKHVWEEKNSYFTASPIYFIILKSTTYDILIVMYPSRIKIKVI